MEHNEKIKQAAQRQALDLASRLYSLGAKVVVRPSTSSNSHYVFASWLDAKGEKRTIVVRFSDHVGRRYVDYNIDVTRGCKGRVREIKAAVQRSMADENGFSRREAALAKRLAMSLHGYSRAEIAHCVRTNIRNLPSNKVNKIARHVLRLINGGGNGSAHMQ